MTLIALSLVQYVAFLALLAGIWRGLRGLGASVSSLIQQLLCHFIAPPGHGFKSLKPSNQKNAKTNILQSKVNTKYGAFTKQTEQHTSLFHFFYHFKVPT